MSFFSWLANLAGLVTDETVAFFRSRFQKFETALTLFFVIVPAMFVIGMVIARLGAEDAGQFIMNLAGVIAAILLLAAWVQFGSAAVGFLIIQGAAVGVTQAASDAMADSPEDLHKIPQAISNTEAWRIMRIAGSIFATIMIGAVVGTIVPLYRNFGATLAILVCVGFLSFAASSWSATHYWLPRLQRWSMVFASLAICWFVFVICVPQYKDTAVAAVVSSVDRSIGTNLRGWSARKDKQSEIVSVANGDTLVIQDQLATKLQVIRDKEMRGEALTADDLAMKRKNIERFNQLTENGWFASEAKAMPSWLWLSFCAFAILFLVGSIVVSAQRKSVGPLLTSFALVVVVGLTLSWWYGWNFHPAGQDRVSNAISKVESEISPPADNVVVVPANRQTTIATINYPQKGIEITSVTGEVNSASDASGDYYRWNGSTGWDKTSPVPGQLVVPSKPYMAILARTGKGDFQIVKPGLVIQAPKVGAMCLEIVVNDVRYDPEGHYRPDYWAENQGGFSITYRKVGP